MGWWYNVIVGLALVALVVFFLKSKKII